MTRTRNGVELFRRALDGSYRVFTECFEEWQLVGVVRRVRVASEATGWRPVWR